MALFVGAELLLVMSIPFLAIAGYHALLDSHAGHFVEEPQPGEPGWRAVVDPSPLHAVVEMYDGDLTGIALLVGHIDDSTGGTVVVIPGTLVVEGEPLAGRDPAAAVASLGRTLRLRIPTHDVVDAERWPAVLGSSTYAVSNPDPVAGPDGQPLLAVGPMTVDGDNAALFLGRPAPGSDPVTVLFRRHLFWSSTLADPPAGDDPLAAVIAQVSGPSAQVVDLPLVAVTPRPEPDADAVEALVREIVPIPAGAVPGDRIQVRVVDRTGTADLATVAADLAATGAEVVEIGNAPTFDGGTTVLVVPPEVDQSAVSDLALAVGATTVADDEADGDAVVTLLIGVDLVTDR